MRCQIVGQYLETFLWARSWTGAQCACKHGLNEMSITLGFEARGNRFFSIIFIFASSGSSSGDNVSLFKVRMYYCLSFCFQESLVYGVVKGHHIKKIQLLNLIFDLLLI